VSLSQKRDRLISSTENATNPVTAVNSSSTSSFLSRPSSFLLDRFLRGPLLAVALPAAAKHLVEPRGEFLRRSRVDCVTCHLCSSSTAIRSHEQPNSTMNGDIHRAVPLVKYTEEQYSIRMSENSSSDDVLHAPQKGRGTGLAPQNVFCRSPSCLISIIRIRRRRTARRATVQRSFSWIPVSRLFPEQQPRHFHFGSV